MRAFVLLFGVAGKCSLILLLCRRDFCVGLVSLNDTETINLLFSQCFSITRFVFNFCLSISSPEVSANCNFLLEACMILLFVTVHFHVLFSVVLHLILRFLCYIYLSFSVILFPCFLCFYSIFHVFCRCCWLSHNSTFTNYLLSLE